MAATPSIEVVLPSGAKFEVLTPEEADYIEVQTLAYLAAFTIGNPSDMADLDAILRGEMLVRRWETWMSRGRDWNNEPIDVRHFVDAAKKVGSEVRQLKAQLGIDKKTRDRTTGDGSPAEFIARVLTAARHMGIHRREQVDLVLELAMQMRTLVTVYRNSDDEERRLFRCTAEDIIEWVLEVFDPEMAAHDLYFQENVQAPIWAGRL